MIGSLKLIVSWLGGKETIEFQKFESLLYEINTKNYHLHWIMGRANILSKFIIYIFFNFGPGFYGPFPMLFPKAPASCCKKTLN